MFQKVFQWMATCILPLWFEEWIISLAFIVFCQNSYFYSLPFTEICFCSGLYSYFLLSKVSVKVEGIVLKTRKTNWITFSCHFYLIDWLLDTISSNDLFRSTSYASVNDFWRSQSLDESVGLGGSHVAFSKWDVELRSIFMIKTGIQKLLT